MLLDLEIYSEDILLTLVNMFRAFSPSNLSKSQNTYRRTMLRRNRTRFRVKMENIEDAAVATIDSDVKMIILSTIREYRFSFHYSCLKT